MASFVGQNLKPLTEKQEEIVETIHLHRNAYVIGGKGSGKSIGTAYAAAMFAYHWAPGIDGLAFAPTWQQLKDLIIGTWKLVAPKGLYEIRTSGTKDAGAHIKILVPQENGPPLTSKIYLRTEEACDRIEGLTVGWAWGEEIQDCERIWDLSGDRIRDIDCPHLARFGAGLPEQGWIEEVFYEIPDGKYDPETDSAWVHCTTYDNEKYLAPGHIQQQEKELSPELFRKRVLGHFVAAKDTVYPTFDRRIHVRSCAVIPSAPLYVGVDFNNHPMTAAFIQHHSVEFWQVAELAFSGTTIEQARRIRQWCQKNGFEHTNKKQVKVIPDASGSSKQHGTGKSDHEFLRQEGLHLFGPRRNPFIKDRDNAVSKALLSAQGKASLFFDPSCQDTIKSFTKLKHKGRERSPHSHLPDCVGYVVHRVAPVIERPNVKPISVHRTKQIPLFRRPGRHGGTFL